MNIRVVCGLLFLHLLALPSAAEDLSAYFPSAKGLSWRFKVTKHSVIAAAGESRRTDKNGITLEEVVGTAGSSTTIIQRTVNETNSTMGNVTVRSVLHVRTEPDSVSIVAVGAGAASPRRLAVPQLLLSSQIPGPLIDGHQGALLLSTQLVSQSSSKAEVPAGSFTDCLLTEAKGPVSGALNGMPVRNGTISVKSWYARGVGLVREDRILDFVVSTPDGAAVTVQEAASKVLESHTGL